MVESCGFALSTFSIDQNCALRGCSLILRVDLVPSELFVKNFNNTIEVLDDLEKGSWLFAIEFLVSYSCSIFFKNFQVLLVRFWLLTKSKSITLRLILHCAFIVSSFELREMVWDQYLLSDIKASIHHQLMKFDSKLRLCLYVLAWERTKDGTVIHDILYR